MIILKYTIGLITNTKEAEYVLSDDLLFRETCLYKMQIYGGEIQFPKKHDPNGILDKKCGK